MDVAEGDGKVAEAIRQLVGAAPLPLASGQVGKDVGRHARTLVGAVAFLAWRRGHGLTIETCTQAHVELWLAGPPGRRLAHGIVRWARKRRLAHDLDIVSRRDPIPGRSVDADQHLGVARGFATDETLPHVDRLARKALRVIRGGFRIVPSPRKRSSGRRRSAPDVGLPNRRETKR